MAFPPPPPAVVRRPACHSRRFKGERPIGAATGQQSQPPTPCAKPPAPPPLRPPPPSPRCFGRTMTQTSAVSLGPAPWPSAERPPGPSPSSPRRPHNTPRHAPHAGLFPPALRWQGPWERGPEMASHARTHAGQSSKGRGTTARTAGGEGGMRGLSMALKGGPLQYNARLSAVQNTFGGRGWVGGWVGGWVSE